MALKDTLLYAVLAAPYQKTKLSTFQGHSFFVFVFLTINFWLAFFVFVFVILTINFLFQGFVFPLALGSRQSVGRSRRVAVVAVRAARAAAFFLAKIKIQNLAADAAKF